MLANPHPPQCPSHPTFQAIKFFNAFYNAGTKIPPILGPQSPYIFGCVNILYLLCYLTPIHPTAPVTLHFGISKYLIFFKRLTAPPILGFPTYLTFWTTCPHPPQDPQSLYILGYLNILFFNSLFKNTTHLTAPVTLHFRLFKYFIFLMIPNPHPPQCPSHPTFQAIQFFNAFLMKAQTSHPPQGTSHPTFWAV